MRTLFLFSCVVVFFFCTFAESKNGLHPSQVHLSLGTDETEMLVTWVLKSGSVHDTPIVEYGSSENGLHHKATAEETHFKEGQTEFRTYRALMTGLTPGGSTVFYRVGSSGTAWSKVFHFRTLSKSSISSNWLPRLAIYGDLGYSNAQSTPFLVKEVEAGHFDAIFHSGDFAYDLHSKDGERGHQFMEMIEPIAAQVPYLTIPGNHEEHANFSHYDARFSMLGDRHLPEDHKSSKILSHRLNNHFHSMTIGPVQVIMINTEYYYYTKYGWEQIARQYEWLEQELKRANANRATAPWVVVLGHRPLYCLKKKDKKKGGDDSDDDAGECDIEAMERPTLRKGIKMHGNGNLQYGLEELFFKYGVDLYFAGHEHHYGRTTPLYDQVIKSGHRSPANPYDDPAGPVHFITGAAGNKQEHGSFNKHPKSWLARTSPDYGYTRLSFKSRLHLVLEQTSDEQGGAVIDKIELIKYQSRPAWMP